MIRSLLFTALFSIISFSSALIMAQEEPKTEAKPTDPLEGAEVIELKDADLASLVKREGETVVVVGRVERVATSGSITFLNFEGGFTAVSFTKDRERLETAFRQTLKELLEGQRLQLRGEIALYKGKAQIVVQEVSQIALAKNEPQAPPERSLKAGDERGLEKAFEEKIKSVMVEGEVEEVRFLPSGLALLDFRRSDFSGVVSSQNREAIEKALGGKLEEVLPKKKVQITGTIEKHRDNPQIEITSGFQIKVLK